MADDNGEDTSPSRAEIDPAAPKTYQEALAVKQSRASKADSARLKHNRNARPGYELADQAKDSETEQRIKKELNRKLRRPNTRYQQSTLDKIIELRGQGLSYAEISRRPAMPSEGHIGDILADDPQYKESCEQAYDGYVEGLIERQIRLIDTADDTMGLGPKIPRMVLDALEIDDRDLRRDQIHAANVLTRHGSAVASARLARVGRALQTGAQHSPDRWGYNHDTGSDVIVIETPGGMWMQPASATPDDPDGQGSAAAEARQRWRETRDVTPRTR